MGKTKKKSTLKAVRSGPLDRQIEEDGLARPTGRVKARRDRRADHEEQFVDEKLSKKILSQARKQQQDLEDDIDYDGLEEQDPTSKKIKRVTLATGDDDSDNDIEAGPGRLDQDFDETFFEDLQIDADDERAIERFMSKEATKRKTLAEMIAEKLKEKETEIETQFSQAGDLKYQELDPRVVEMYHGVGEVLSRYRSGKIPKAFKIIPALSNWEQVLELTKPDRWSAAAMFAATRLFASNLKEKMAQRFFNLILLPRVRDDIYEYKRLNFHLYQALRKALFKPGAFFKGIMLPLCEGRDCTLREAVIIGSVVAKNHVPILHSCAAMLKIAEMEYSGANSVFLNILIGKKYALPYRVIDGLVHHFLRFVADRRELPVLWHQCLLVFVENYKSDLSSEQKEALLDLLRVHTHHQITAVIRSHLFNANARDVEDQQPMMANDEDQVPATSKVQFQASSKKNRVKQQRVDMDSDEEADSSDDSDDDDESM